MRRKNSLISLGMLAVVLVLGVGYAVVSTVELNFGGTASVADAPINVTISNAQSSTTGSAKITHSWKNPTDITDSFTISDIALNETVTITYTVKNNETDVTATFSEIGSITNSNTEYFAVSRTKSFTELDPGKTGTVTITIKLKKTPIENEDGIATISYKVKASPKSYEDDFTGGGGSND